MRATTPRSTDWALSVAFFTALLGAACPPPPSLPDDAGVVPARDAGRASDSGVDAGGSTTTDGGDVLDGGATDGGLTDGGSMADAGSFDAGSALDAGAAVDSGVALDAGATPDAGGTFDAGTSPDSGAAFDGGSTPPDGGSPDSGAPDAGGSIDGGLVDLDSLPEGYLAAHASVSREVVREFASDDAQDDDRVQFFPGTAGDITHFRWRLVRSDTQVELWRSSSASPIYDFAAGTRGEYDVELTVSNGTTRSRFYFRRLVTVVLPRTANGRRVFSLDVTSNITVAPNTNVPLVGGGTSTIQPGDLVRLTATSSQGGSVTFVGLGTAGAAPVHIISPAAGPLTLSRQGTMLTLLNCQNVIIDGFGHGSGPSPMPDPAYGLVLRNTNPSGAQALFARADFGQNGVGPRCQGPFEFYGVRIDNEAGTGIEVRTTAVLGTYDGGPYQLDSTTCSVPRLRVHHTFMERTGQEGFYLGYTHDGINADNQFAYPIQDAKVYRNRIQNSGRDGLQVCNARPNLEVHDNSMHDAGTNGESAHLSGMQYNAGNSGHVYNNVIVGGTGLFIDVGCAGGDSTFFNNVVHPLASISSHAVYVRSGGALGVDYALFHNTLIAEAQYGVRLDMGRSPTYDCNDGSSVGRLDSLVVAHNGAVLSAASNPANDFCACASSPGLCAPVLHEYSNVASVPATANTFCFADAPADDYEPVCSSSSMLTPLPVEPLLDAGISTARLPIPLWFDATGRVSFSPPMHKGAFSQTKR